MLVLKAGQGCHLRPWQAEDADRLWALTESNRERFGEWLAWPGQTRSVTDVGRFIEATRAALLDGSGCDLAVVVDGTVVGGAGLCEVTPPPGYGILGYWIDQAAEGRGIMSAACQAVLRHGFEDLELERVELWTMAGNRRSRALAERLGFVHEGTLHRRAHHRGRWHDRVVYGMLRQHWPVHPPSSGREGSPV